jgi:hypothetical protein
VAALRSRLHDPHDRGRAVLCLGLVWLLPRSAHQFATLFNRLADDFLAYDAEQGPAA